MPKKRHKAEEIVLKLRQVDVLTSQGSMMAKLIPLVGSFLRRWLTILPSATGFQMSSYDPLGTSLLKLIDFR